MKQKFIMQKIFLWIIVLFVPPCSAMEMPFRPPATSVQAPQRREHTTEIQSGRARAEQRLDEELNRQESPFAEFVSIIIRDNPNAQRWTNIIPFIDVTQRPQAIPTSFHASLYDFVNVDRPYGWGFYEPDIPFIAVAYNFYENGILIPELARRVGIQTFVLLSPGNWQILEWGFNSLALFTTFEPNHQLSFKAVATLIVDYFIKILRGNPERSFSVHLPSKYNLRALIEKPYLHQTRQVPQSETKSTSQTAAHQLVTHGRGNAQARALHLLNQEAQKTNSPFCQFINSLMQRNPRVRHWTEIIPGPLDISGRANDRSYHPRRYPTETFYITIQDFLSIGLPYAWGYDESGTPFITVAYQFYESGILTQAFCYLHYPYKYPCGYACGITPGTVTMAVIQTFVLREGSWQIFDYGFIPSERSRQFTPSDTRLSFQNSASLLGDNFIKVKRGHYQIPYLIRLAHLSELGAKF